MKSPIRLLEAWHADQETGDWIDPQTGERIAGSEPAGLRMIDDVRLSHSLSVLGEHNAYNDSGDETNQDFRCR